jgi:hypothetical protein
MCSYVMDRGFHLVVSQALLPACFESIITMLETKLHTCMSKQAGESKGRKMKSDM